MNGGRKDQSTVRPTYAIAKPVAPPTRASRMHSVSICRISRGLLAPRAARRPISFSRRAARARSRLARFAQAIKSTNPTTVIIIVPASPIWSCTLTPTAASVKGVSAMLRPALSFGKSFSSFAAMVFSEASAWRNPVSGLSLATARAFGNLRSLKNSLANPVRAWGYMLVGIQICSALPKVSVPLKPFGDTPMMVYGMAFSVSVLPTASLSEPSLLVQKL